MKKKYWFYGLITIGILLLLCWICVPRPLFTPQYSYALYDKSDQLMGAKISRDGQWRFAIADELPKEYIEALV